MTQKKVHVIGREHAYEQMFLKNGWELARNIEDAEFIQFTGGADVDPMLYHEPAHPTTGSNPIRDAAESHIFHTYSGKKRMLGICRGSQFLNVMCGGWLWQNVDRHAVGGTHDAFDIDSNEVVQVSSTHHQMMIPGEGASILVTAGRTTVKEDGYGVHKQNQNEQDRDIEAVFYQDENTLCFQPHPEFFGPEHECQRLYFDLIKRHLF